MIHATATLGVICAVGAMGFISGWIITDRITMNHTCGRRDAEAKLRAIEDLEVHGREFIDAAESYRILGKPIPEPIDHAANIRARDPYRSPYT